MSIIMARWKWATAPALRSDAGTSYVAGRWRKLSLGAELMVDPGCGTRCAIRGARRSHWTVALLGETDPVAAGRTGELGEARSLGILAYVEGGEPSSRGRDNGSLARWKGEVVR
jgi:hypothetical protein